MESEQSRKCISMASRMRQEMIGLSKSIGTASAHWGGGLSCVEILAVLYGAVLNFVGKDLPFEDRDKLILSKGHASMTLYSAMVQSGVMDRDLLAQFQGNGSPLVELAVADDRLGIECSGGSLGLGLSFGVGLALLARRKGHIYHSYVVTGDGEMDEGSVWEAVMAASQFKLDNLTLIIDVNRLQADGSTDDIMSWANLEDRLSAFGWDTCAIDGHSCEQLLGVLLKRKRTGMPLAVVAHTIKGKGVSFMENDASWHDAVLGGAPLEQAKREVGLA